MTPGTGREAGSLRSLERGLQILSYVQAHGQVSANDIVAALEIPLSTVYRYISALVLSGFIVEFDNQIVASQRLADMSRDRFAEVKTLAAPVLEQLALRTRQSVAINVRMHLASLCLDVRRAHYVVTTHRAGRALALYAGASATPLLAMAPAEIRERVLGGRITAFTAATPDRERLRTEVQRVRSEGFHVTRGWITAGMTAVGVPVMVDEECVCCLSVIGADRQIPDNPRGIVHALQEAADGLARSIQSNSPKEESHDPCP